MSVTIADVESFHQFAREQLSDGETDFNWFELLDLWKLATPSDAQRHEDWLAIKAAIRDLENGDPGIPVEDAIREVRNRHSTPANS